MKNYKVFVPEEMDAVFAVYRGTKSMDVFVEKVTKEFPNIFDHEVIVSVWQAFDYMYDHFNIQEAE